MINMHLRVLMQNSNRKKEKEREIIQNNEILEIDGEMKNGVS